VSVGFVETTGGARRLIYFQRRKYPSGNYLLV